MEDTTPSTAPMEDTTSSTAPPNNKRNYFNLASYLLNVFITYGFGVFGRDNQTNEYLSLKYQTLVTPASWAFAIWGVIFIAQAVFAVVQLLPDHRAKPLVQDGVGDYYVGVCAAQIMWTISFGEEYIGLSLIAMLFILYLLVQIVKNHYEMYDCEAETHQDYWFFRFPFEIHLGWIIAATFVNFNVWLVSLDVPRQGLLAAAIFSLIGIVIVAAGSLWYLKRPNFAVSGALAWAVIGVSEELGDPKQSIFNEFTAESITGLKATSAVLATFVLALLAARAVKIYMKHRGKELRTLCVSVPEGEDLEESDADYVKA